MKRRDFLKTATAVPVAGAVAPLALTSETARAQGAAKSAGAI